MEFNVRRRAILNLCRMEVNLGMRTSELKGSKDMASEMTVENTMDSQSIWEG